MQESPKPQAVVPKLGPNIIRGVLVLSGLGTRSESPGRDSVMSRAALLDISGRKVLDLRPGPNDVSRLTAGVYFVRSVPVAVGRGASAVTKVVIQR